MTIYERRRVIIAALITLVALPALWWAKRDNPISSPGVAAVDAGGGLATGAEAPPAADITPVGMPPGYLSGPSQSIPALLSEPTGPPLDDSFTRSGLASFRNFTEVSDKLCEVEFLPDGLRITVENTDNGKKVDCLVNRVRLPDDVLMVLDSTLFAELSDLAEAPIPVRIRW